MEKEMNMMTFEQKLANGLHLVTFTKKDGTVCSRWLTMDPTLVPDFVPKTDRITRQSLDTVRVWDTEKQGFISLIRANISAF